MTAKPLAALAAALSLAACATSEPQVAAPAENLNIGIASACTASPTGLDAAAGAPATISMSNDGWCAIRVTERDGQPFLYGKVPPAGRAQNGSINIQKIGGQTRVEYMPRPGFTGTDQFEVALVSRTPGTPDRPLRVVATVTPSPNAPPVAAAPAPTPAAATPASTGTPARQSAPAAPRAPRR